MADYSYLIELNNMLEEAKQEKTAAPVDPFKYLTRGLKQSLTPAVNWGAGGAALGGIGGFLDPSSPTNLMGQSSPSFTDRLRSAMGGAVVGGMMGAGMGAAPKMLKGMRQTAKALTPKGRKTPTTGAPANPESGPTPTPTPGSGPTPTPGSGPTPTPTPGSGPTPTPTPGSGPTPTPTPGLGPIPTQTVKGTKKTRANKQRQQRQQQQADQAVHMNSNMAGADVEAARHAANAAQAQANQQAAQFAQSNAQLMQQSPYVVPAPAPAPSYMDMVKRIPGQMVDSYRNNPTLFNRLNTGVHDLMGRLRSAIGFLTNKGAPVVQPPINNTTTGFMP